MKVSWHIIIILFFLSTKFYGSDIGIITVNVKTFIINRGDLHVGLFDNKNRFGLHHVSNAFKKRVVKIESNAATVVFDSIPSGEYAIAVFQDLNKNSRFEFAKEDYGFSGDGVILITSPSFKNNKFNFDGTGLALTLHLINEENKIVNNSKSIAYAPVISYAPESKWQAGISIVSLFKIKKGDSLTRTSYTDMFALVTQNKQAMVKHNYTIFTDREKYIITGSTWFQYFPQYYFGVGNDLSDMNKQIIHYKQFKIDILIQRKIYKKIFFGLGYRNSTLFNVSSAENGILNQTKYFGYRGSSVSGLQAAITSDNRDNIYYAAKGHYLRIKSTFNYSYFGSQFNFQAHEIDIMKYWKPFSSRWDVIAFNAYGYFTAGDIPWNELAAMGSDVLMRGYYSGRYRDKDYMAMQVEYRLPINRLFGVAVFAGMGEVANKLKNFTMQGLKPNGGLGVRVKIDRKERLNLRIDMGIGNQGVNFYLSAAEAF